MEWTVLFLGQEGGPDPIGDFVVHYFIAPILTLLYRLIVGNWIYINICLAVFFIIRLWLHTIKMEGLWSYSTCVILGTICSGLSIYLICYTPLVMELETGFNLWLKRTTWDYMDWNEESLFLSTSLAIIFLFCSYICTIHQGCWTDSSGGYKDGDEPSYRMMEQQKEFKRQNPTATLHGLGSMDSKKKKDSKKKD